VTALEEGCPSLVLLDVDLPDGSGWEVLRALRRQGCQDTRSIVITGLRPNGHLVRELECAAVLEKPFPIETLVRLVVASLTHTGGEMARPVAPGP
jgi:DNA-binding response OmpR family regulator